MRKARENSLKVRHIVQSLNYTPKLTRKIACYAYIISFMLPQMNISNMDVRKYWKWIDKVQHSHLVTEHPCRSFKVYLYVILIIHVNIR